MYIHMCAQICISAHSCMVYGGQKLMLTVFIKYSLLLFTYLCVHLCCVCTCMWACTRNGVHWRSEENMQALVLSFHYEGCSDRTQVIRLDSTYLYPRSHFTSHFSPFITVFFDTMSLAKPGANLFGWTIGE